MARDNELRHPQSESPATTGRFALLQSCSPVHVAAILAILAAAFVAVYQLAGAGGNRKTSAEATFLTRVPGAPQHSAPLVRKPAQGISIALRRSGYTVANRTLTPASKTATRPRPAFCPPRFSRSRVRA